AVGPAAVRLDQAAFGRFGGDAGAVEAATVGAQLDDYAAATVVGAQRDGADGRFAEPLALVGRLDAVVDRVPDHVEERVGDDVDHVPVDLGVLALGLELDGAAHL